VSRGRGRATPWNRPWCVLDEEREKREKEKEKENSGKLGGGEIFWWNFLGFRRRHDAQSEALMGIWARGIPCVGRLPGVTRVERRMSRGLEIDRAQWKIF
jgi:hypothetical protein